MELLISAGILSVVARGLLLKFSGGASVDHYYWIIVAAAFRQQKRLPPDIQNKYILEESQQYYPPGFGYFLAHLPDRFLRSAYSKYIPQLFDLATLVVLGGFFLAIGLSADDLWVLVLIYGLAPVLCAYNVQLTSRGMGNFLLVVTLVAAVAAVTQDDAWAPLFWVVTALATMGVIVTHKMTTQFMIFLWPFWVLVLGGTVVDTVLLIAMPAIGLALAVLATGRRFQFRQWHAHYQILAFWTRNWPWLGANAIAQSPIYGTPDRAAPGLFHGVGIGDLKRKAVLLTAYLPLGLLLPVTLLEGDLPPAWLLVWWGAAWGAAVSTLFVSFLKGFGGGHLYLFNAVPPSALWWSLALPNGGPIAWGIFLLGLTLTFASLGQAIWIRFKARNNARDGDLDDAVAALRRLPTTRVAILPYASAERVAFETDHAVFWGGHSKDFPLLEAYFPVMRVPFATAFSDHNVGYLLIRDDWMPTDPEVMSREFPDHTVEVFGRWRLYRLSASPKRTIAPRQPPART